MNRVIGPTLVLSACLVCGMSAASFGATDDTGLTIFRGEVPKPVASKSKSQDGQIVKLAGERLWIVDPELDKVTACELSRTTQVGGRKIRCASRTLSID